jgi:hypothetical protein
VIGFSPPSSGSITSNYLIQVAPGTGGSPIGKVFSIIYDAVTSSPSNFMLSTYARPGNSASERDYYLTNVKISDGTLNWSLDPGT